MTPEEWVYHYRNMKPCTYALTSYNEGRILETLNEVLRIVKPNDADEIKKHVIKMIEQSPHTNYCGD